MFETESNSLNTESNSNNDSIDTTKYKIKKNKKKNNVVDFNAIKLIKKNTGNPQETKDIEDLSKQ